MSSVLYELSEENLIKAYKNWNKQKKPENGKGNLFSIFDRIHNLTFDKKANDYRELYKQCNYNRFNLFMLNDNNDKFIFENYEKISDLNDDTKNIIKNTVVEDLQNEKKLNNDKIYIQEFSKELEKQYENLLFDLYEEKDLENYIPLLLKKSKDKENKYDFYMLDNKNCYKKEVLSVIYIYIDYFMFFLQEAISNNYDNSFKNVYIEKDQDKNQGDYTLNDYYVNVVEKILNGNIPLIEKVVGDDNQEGGIKMKRFKKKHVNKKKKQSIKKKRTKKQNKKTIKNKKKQKQQKKKIKKKKTLKKK